MDHQEFTEQLASLDRRLGRLERLLRAKSWPEHLAEAPRQAVMVQPAPIIAKAATVTCAQAPAEAFGLLQGQPPLRAAPPPLPPVTEHQLMPSPTPNKQTTLEQAIGLKWAGWIGAVVLVMGAAFGIKYCYDQGWFTFVTPPIRLVMLAMGGFALIAAGEMVYRKVNRLSAAGLFGAGVAVLFIVSYAGYAFYDLYAPNVAFAFMGVSTIVGTLVARRGRLVSIAVLSMIGGNLAPALLHADHPQLTGFLFYLLVLQLTSLALAAWGASPRWWTLRGLSLVTTSLWVLAVLNLQPRYTLDIFALVFAALYQAELICSAYRSRLDAGTAGITFSILVTGGLSAALLHLFATAPVSARVCLVLGLACIVAAIGYSCRKLGRDGSPLRALSVGFALQALALLVLAAPIAFSGIWISVSWCVLAVLLAGAGYLLDQTMPRWTATVVWALAAGDLLLWLADPTGKSHLSQTAMSLHGVAIPVYAFDGWMLAIAAHLIATIVRQRRHDGVSIAMRATAQTLSIAGSCVWLIVTIAALPMHSATVGLLVLGWILLSSSVLDDELQLSVQAAGLFALAAIKWAINDTLITRFSPDWSPAGSLPFLTPGIGVATLIALSLWSIRYIPRSTNPLLSNARKLVGSSMLATLVLIWAGTFEVDRIIRQYIPEGAINLSAAQWLLFSWTIWWMLCSCAHLLIAYWFSRGDRPRQTAAITRMGKVFALLAVKYIAVDRLYFRLQGSIGSSAVFAGPEALAGGVVLAGLVLIYCLSYGPTDVRLKTLRNWIVGLCLTLVFFMMTLGIDQAFANARGLASEHAEQVTLSLCWAVCAVLLVISGFIRRTASLRYSGLALFGVVLLKVVTIDLSQASTGYRILSFLAVGALLLGTSVLYGKLSPKLLHQLPAA